MPEAFRHAGARAAAPAPRALFTSSPLRSLDWLLEWPLRAEAALLRAGNTLPAGLSLLAVFDNVALTSEQPASRNGRVIARPAVPA